MQPIPYVFFNMSARDAFTFWGGIFGAEPEIMPAGDAMPGIPPETVMHAALKVGDGWIYGSDDPSGQNFTAMAGCNIHIALPDATEAERVFAALSEGGEIRMPIEKSFWAERFGTCSDKYGVRWMVSTET